MRIRMLSAGIAMILSAPVMAGEFLSWQDGDSAVFRNINSGQEVTVAVDDSASAEWKHVSGFLGRDQWVWTSANSEMVYLWDDVAGDYYPLVNFSAPLGSSYPLSLDTCSNNATLAQKHAVLSTPAGFFDDVIRVDFSGNCADAGLGSAWFARGVGLVQWQEMTIAGPQTMQMVRGDLGGNDYPAAAPMMSMSAEFPASQRIMLGETQQLQASLTVSNTGSEDLVLQFNSSQRFEITLETVDGEVLNVWSANKRFTQAMENITIAPGQSQTFGGAIDLQRLDGQPMDIGTHILRIELRGHTAPDASVFQPAYMNAEKPIYIDSRVTLFGK